MSLTSFLIGQRKAQHKHGAIHRATTKTAVAPSTKYTSQFFFISPIFTRSSLLNQKDLNCITHMTYALSFYRSRMILEPSKLFCMVTIFFGRVTCPNRFGEVQIILIRCKLDFYRLIFIIWTWPKSSGPVRNELDPS